MVNVSHETTEATEQRLRRVIQSSRFVVCDGSWIFEEFPLSEFASRANASALALVRDEQVWSQLVPSTGEDGERFGVFCFHFPPNADNSGFVGWLATHLKRTFGTGVFVTCGQNSGDGGIFDYWGCPIELFDDLSTKWQPWSPERSDHERVAHHRKTPLTRSLQNERSESRRSRTCDLSIFSRHDVRSEESLVNLR
jgi:Family of unknown function (DUF6196)